VCICSRRTGRCRGFRLFLPGGGCGFDAALVRAAPLWLVRRILLRLRMELSRRLFTSRVSCSGKIYKYVVCHLFYDVCHERVQTPRSVLRNSLSPPAHDIHKACQSKCGKRVAPTHHGSQKSKRKWKNWRIALERPVENATR